MGKSNEKHYNSMDEDESSVECTGESNTVLPKPREIRSRRGKISRNAFLNFLTDYRAKHKFMSSVAAARAAAATWNNMDGSMKKQYLNEAKKAPPRNMMDYYILGEHQLSKHFREGLLAFKSAADNYVEQTLNRIKNMELGDNSLGDFK